MSLTKKDLEAIDSVIAKRIQPLGEGQARVEKKIGKIDKKFDKLFNFIDKDVSKMKRVVADKLGIDISTLSATSD